MNQVNILCTILLNFFSEIFFLISLLAIIYFFVGNQYFDYILILAIILLTFTIYNRVKSSLRGE